MKRRARGRWFWLAALLVMGLVTNWLVAAALCVLVDPGKFRLHYALDKAGQRFDHVDLENARRSRFLAFVPTTPEFQRFSVTGIRIDSQHSMRALNAPAFDLDVDMMNVETARVTSGWPFLAWRAELGQTKFWTVGSSVPPRISSHRSGILFEVERRSVYQSPPNFWEDFEKRPVPYAPAFPGALANTFFYAGAWWMLLFTPRVIRGWVRARRGGCARCGYAWAAASVCPECGAMRDGAALP